MSIFQPRILNGHLIMLLGVVVSRLDLLKVIRRQAASLDQESHALVLVLPTIEVDASFFHFLFPQSRIRLLRQGFSHLPLGVCRVECIAVIRVPEFGEQLSSFDMLALFYEYPSHLARDLESHIRCFRSLDRTASRD